MHISSHSFSRHPLEGKKCKKTNTKSKRRCCTFHHRLQIKPLRKSEAAKQRQQKWRKRVIKAGWWRLRGWKVSAGERCEDETCETHMMASKWTSGITPESDKKASTYGRGRVTWWHGRCTYFGAKTDGETDDGGAGLSSYYQRGTNNDATFCTIFWLSGLRTRICQHLQVKKGAR